MAYQSFEDLEVWRSATQLAIDIYRALQDCRDFGIKDQMTRAAVSIASNIAEGSERGTNPDFCRFLHIAKGSAAELRTQLHIATATGVIDQSAATPLMDQTRRISAKLHNLIKSLQRAT